MMTPVPSRPRSVRGGETYASPRRSGCVVILGELQGAEDAARPPSGVLALGLQPATTTPRP